MAETSGLMVLLRQLEGTSGSRISLNLTLSHPEGGGYKARLRLPTSRRKGKRVEGELGSKKCAVVTSSSKAGAVKGVLRLIANRL